MNHNQAKGSFNNANSKSKHNAAPAASKTSVHADGLVDRLKGKLEKGFDEAKEVIKDGVDKIMEKTHTK